MPVWLAYTQAGSYIAVAISAIGALLAYRRSVRLERARWMTALYEKFYEKKEMQRMRELIDCAADHQSVNDILQAEPPDLTDYLNFFEYVAYLRESNQISETDLRALFNYYLNCLKSHKMMVSYIQAKGYEKLANLLGR